MATYGDSASEYPYNPQKRRKQKYSLYTRVVDFTNKLPVTSHAPGNEGFATTAWAAADVLEVFKIRTGQTVLGVQLEILTSSADKADIIQIGYGTDPNRWGTYNLSKGANIKDYPYAEGVMRDATAVPIFVEPLYFSSADSIDITINRAAIQGKIRLIVHLLEDDR